MILISNLIFVPNLNPRLILYSFSGFIDDAPKCSIQSQRARRRESNIKKKQERAESMNANRGFSTDQRISIEALQINKQRLKHQMNETKIVALSIEEAAIGRQVSAAEVRAQQRCPEYDSSNDHWKRVDLLIKDHDKVIDSIRKYREAMTEEVSENEGDEVVTEFLNQKSPEKKRKYVEMSEVNVGDTLAFDVEEVESLTSKTNVRK